MQATELGYWAGVASWGLLLATTMTTTFWLEARSAESVLKWDRLRLAGLGGLLVLAWLNGAGAGIILVGLLYLAANWAFLRTLPKAVQDAQPTVIPADAGIQHP